MGAQLELDLSRRAPPGARPSGRTSRSARALLAWAPVWVPLAFLGQVLLLGLRPARAEAARLERAEAEMRTRVEALEHEARELAQGERMLQDAVFQERVRRSLLDPASAPLTLERARAQRP
jgi:hypothetical protein